MKRQLQTILLLTALVISYIAPVNAQVANNPPYTLEQSVIASGGVAGSNTVGNQFSITGSIGQSVAGTSSSNSPFFLKAGFFTNPMAAPTAAGVTISGRIRMSNGRGIRNITVTLTEADGTTHTILSGASGQYSFTDVVVGQLVILYVKGNRFTFSEPIQILNLIGEATDIDFIAIE